MSFRMLGFDLRFRPSFFLMAAVLALPTGIATAGPLHLLSWVFVATLSIVVHELAHATVSKAFGGHASIEIDSLGGLTAHQLKLSNKARAIVSLCGPIASFALAGLALILQATGLPSHQPIVAHLVRQLLWINLGWGLVNLLPILPLDGGQLLLAGIDAISGRRGKRLTQIVSIWVGLVAASIALLLGGLLVAMIALWCVVTVVRAMRGEGADRHDARLWDDFEAADALIREAYAAGNRQLRQLLSRAKGDRLRARISEQLAWHALHNSRVDDALFALGHMPSTWHASQPLLGGIYRIRGRYTEAIAILEPIVDDYIESPTWWTWIGSALCESYVEAERPERAVAYLSGVMHRLPNRELPATIAHLLFQHEHYGYAAELAKVSFLRFEDPNDAYNVACSTAKLGAQQEALWWLGEAIDAGFVDAEHLDGDEDLASIRELAGYAALRDRLRERTPGD